MNKYIFVINIEEPTELITKSKNKAIKYFLKFEDSTLDIFTDEWVRVGDYEISEDDDYGDVENCIESITIGFECDRWVTGYRN